MTYAVKEIFYTIQGEGINAGRTAVFCRFAGCNLWSGNQKDKAGAVCNFCDTDFVGGFRVAQAMDVACDSEGMPKAKLHGLRMLDPTVFSHLPLSSADSTNVARNIGLDSKWLGPYAPKSLTTRALLMMERIEIHASARRWCGSGGGAHSNLELFG